MKKNVWLYLVFTFVLTYGAVFGLMLTGTAYGSPLCMAVFSLCMLFPALCSILTRLVTKEGFSEMYLKPRLKGHWLLLSGRIDRAFCSHRHRCSFLFSAFFPINLIRA